MIKLLTQRSDYERILLERLPQSTMKIIGKSGSLYFDLLIDLLTGNLPLIVTSAKLA